MRKNYCDTLLECLYSFKEHYRSSLQAALDRSYTTAQVRAIDNMLELAIMHAYDYGYMQGMSRCEEIAKEVVNGIR